MPLVPLAVQEPSTSSSKLQHATMRLPKKSLVFQGRENPDETQFSLPPQTKVVAIGKQHHIVQRGALKRKDLNGNRITRGYINTFPPKYRTCNYYDNHRYTTCNYSSNIYIYIYHVCRYNMKL